MKSEKVKPSRTSSEKVFWLRGPDLNRRPPGYEPDELPGCSTPRYMNFSAPFLQVQELLYTIEVGFARLFLKYLKNRSTIFLTPFALSIYKAAKTYKLKRCYKWLRLLLKTIKEGSGTA